MSRDCASSFFPKIERTSADGHRLCVMQLAPSVGTLVVNLILEQNSGEFGRSLDRPLVSFGGSSHFHLKLRQCLVGPLARFLRQFRLLDRLYIGGVLSHNDHRNHTHAIMRRALYDIDSGRIERLL